MRTRRPHRVRWLTVVAILAACGAILALTGCGTSGTGGGDGARVVVTTPVLGAIVSDLVGDAAEVRVLIPNGADPHDFQPSAQDVVALTDADVVVANGLLLEEGLAGALEEAERSGVTVLHATDHAGTRAVAEGDHAHEDDEHTGGDPHIWMDPTTMTAVVRGMAPELEAALGTDLGTRPDEVATGLLALTEEIDARLADIPPERRTLVTGHDSMGYLADRFGFEVVGAIIPSLSTQAEVSAGDLAALRARIERESVPAIFTELGTPPDVAQAIAAETGARVVAVRTHTLPAEGTYAAFMRDVAASIGAGLRG